MSGTASETIPVPRRVVITSIHHGSAKQGRQDRVYATLVEASSGETLMTATLDTILDAVKGRGFILVKTLDQVAA